MAGRKVAQPSEFDQQWRMIRFISRFSAGLFPSREEIQLWMGCNPTDLIIEMIRADIIIPIINSPKGLGPSTFAGYTLTDRGRGIVKDFEDDERIEYDRRRTQQARDCGTAGSKRTGSGQMEFGAGGAPHRGKRKPAGD